MKKQNILLSLILFSILLSSFSFGQTLIDSDDFESYDLGKNYTNIHDVSGGKWWCPAGNCEWTGCGGFNGVADFAIESYAGEKVLTMWGLDGNSCANAGYKLTRMFWNHTDTSTLAVSPNKTISYKMRINEFQSGRVGVGLEFAGGDLLRPRIQVATDYIYSATELGYIGVGSILQYNMFNYTMLRPSLNAGGWFLPTESNCFVNDGAWHDVHLNYISDGANLINTLVYIDGVECEDYAKAYAIGGAFTQDEINFQAIATFNVSFDDIKVYDGLYIPLQSFDSEILNCPIGNCIYYDDFKYLDNYDLSAVDYYEDTENFVVEDGFLWGNVSDGNGAKYLKYDFTTDTTNYYIIHNVVKFNINETFPTPPVLYNGENYVSYEFIVLCDGNIPAYNYQVFLTHDEDYWDNENGSLINVYFVHENGYQQIGTLMIENGGYFIIETEFNKPLQYVDLSYIAGLSTLPVDYSQSVDFSFSPSAQCDDITGFQIGRRDYTSNVTNFLKVDKIFFYGDVLDSEPVYFYSSTSNATSLNDSLIKVNVDDMLHKASDSLGFRSVGGKMLFWFLILLFLGITTFRSGVPDGIRTPLIIVAGILGFFIGWYLKFIPTSIFAFVVFVICLAGAVVFQRTFSGQAV